MIDSAALQPHRPVDIGDPQYTLRPDRAGDRIAALIHAGKSAVLVAGAVGVGKTTELHRAAELIRESALPIVIWLDRVANVRHLTYDDTLRIVTRRIVDVALQEPALPLSEDLMLTLKAMGVLQSQTGFLNPTTRVMSPLALAKATIAEVKRLSSSGALLLLIDGLEKGEPDEPEQAQPAIRALRDLIDSVQMVVVMPWNRVYGPDADSVLQSGETLIAVRPIDTREASFNEAKSFFCELLNRRLKQAPTTQFPPDFSVVLTDAVLWSGGIPRTFLQLLADATIYQFLRGDTAGWPTKEDLAQAVSDQRGSLLRLLLPRDKQEMYLAQMTSGTEMRLDRKLRLLSHGLLVERATESGLSELHVHPLVEQQINASTLSAIGRL